MAHSYPWHRCRYAPTLCESETARLTRRDRPPVATMLLNRNATVARPLAFSAVRLQPVVTHGLFFLPNYATAFVAG